MLKTLIIIIFFSTTVDAKIIWYGPREKKEVALTFDDGPKPGISDPILNILDKYGVRASFFLTGKESKENPDLVFRIAGSGHTLANHSYTHANQSLLTEKGVQSELKKTNRSLSKQTGKAIRYFRPPGGKYNTRVVKIAEQEGLTTVLWDINAGDYTTRLSKDHAPIAQNVIKQVKPGSIILLHNGGKETESALIDIIETLQKKNYTFVTLDTMLSIQ